MSQTANLVGNLSFLPFRAGARTIAASFDFLQSAIRGRRRKIEVSPVSGTIEAAKGAMRGASKIPEILAKGTGNVVLGETRANLQPLKAWVRQFSKNPDMPTVGGKITLQDRVNLLIEGTMGVPAEAMLRMLGAGDKPFREAARARATTEQLQLAKVPKSQWSMAQKFPELFFDKAKLEEIKNQSDFAVFQRESRTLGTLTRWIASKGDLFDFAVATVAPYKTTPWNIIGEILSYNPVIATAQSLRHAKNKNVREANMNAAKLVVGTMLTATGYLLYKNGLLSPSLDAKDESMKERILSGQVMPPNHVNLSGLDRFRKGGSPAFQPGDKTVDIMRSGGLAGAFFYMTANVGRDMEKKPEAGDQDLIWSILTQSTLEQARFGMNQSFLSGVEGLLSAIKDGTTDSYVTKWGNTVTSIPLPNTMTALSRATREHKPDMTADGFKKKVENIFRNRLGWAGLDDEMPLKRGLWGEPLKETPEGRNAAIYQFFDVSKGQQITSDPKKLELYRLWRKTDNTRVIPTPPRASITIQSKTYPLDTKLHERLSELVGGRREQLADMIITNPNWHTLTDEQKIAMLSMAYDKGMEAGKDEFWKEHGSELEAKPAKSGFQQP
jgi:hypothetical protein